MMSNERASLLPSFRGSQRRVWSKCRSNVLALAFLTFSSAIAVAATGEAEPLTPTQLPPTPPSPTPSPTPVPTPVPTPTPSPSPTPGPTIIDAGRF